MAIDASGELWRGENFEDLATYVRSHQAGGYPVAHVRERICRTCQGAAFRMLVDDEQGCAVTTCLGCGTGAPIADSGDYLDEAELGECACPCGAEEFAVAVGFATGEEDSEVRWISVALRCLTDGTLGVYTDWKIDYAPTAHLLEEV